MSTPEWSLFDRLDELEDITLKLMEKAETTEPTLKDTAILAETAFLLGVGLEIVNAPNRIEAKDATIAFLKVSGLSKEKLDRMDELVTAICEAAGKKPR